MSFNLPPPIYKPSFSITRASHVVHRVSDLAASINRTTFPTEEHYDLEVVVSVLSTSGDQQYASQRAFTILVEVEALLRSDPRCGGIVRVARMGGPLRLEEITDGGQTREGRVTATIHVEARI